VLRRPGNDLNLPQVLGFYTLALGTLEKRVLPEDLAKGLAHYPIPVTIIGRLARHLRVRGQGYGERLLLDAHERVLAISEQAGCFAIVVDAKDSAAAAFYKAFGYVPLEASSRETQAWPQRMIQSLNIIRAEHERA
jgi:predicted GNAT family N-acyltransferase